MPQRVPGQGCEESARTESTHPKVEVNGPSFERDEVYGLEQKPQDMIDEAIMESFPCSDPPSFTYAHI